MNVITYRLLLEQPLLATQLLGDPNSSVSLPYVPGSLLRGMLIQRYLEGKQPSANDNLFGNTPFQRLFFDGAVRYLNAYPLNESNQRTLPTPLSLLKRKKDELNNSGWLDLYNAAHPDASDDERREFEGEDSSRPLSYQFCRITPDKQVTLYHLAPNRVATHVLRSRPKGRATREQGTVFRYEAVAEDQWFSGAVLVEADEDVAFLEALFNQHNVGWLGRSRSANYGRVHMSDVTVVEAETWREAGGSTTPIGATLSLTLLSDTLLRNATGQHTALIDDQTLSAYLGVQGTVESAHTFTQPVQVGGYNRAWQMPLPQASAIKAGSVIVFKPAEVLDHNRLAELEWRGIGERRAEGFGRIAFNWQTELLPTGSSGNLLNHTAHLTELSVAAQRTAQRMARRLLEQRIEEEIRIYLRDHVWNKPLGLMPANSQLGRVRVLIRRTLNIKPLDLQRLRLHLDEFKPVARHQFERARFDGQSLWDWMDGLVSAPAVGTPQTAHHIHVIWQKLGISDARLPAIGGYTADLDDDLSYRTALRLIEAVFVAIARKSRQEHEVPA